MKHEYTNIKKKLSNHILEAEAFLWNTFCNSLK